MPAAFKLYLKRTSVLMTMLASNDTFYEAGICLMRLFLVRSLQLSLFH